MNSIAERKASHLPPHFRRNFVAILVDYVSFGVAFSFADPGTVMPAFVSLLTSSEPIVGLVGTVFSAGWLLPQLYSAALMNASPRKKPYLMFTVYAGRPLILLLGLLTWTSLPRYPTSMLTVFFTILGLFTVLDGVASVAWFDILARTIPIARRGRLIGAGQLTTGVLGIGVGVLVEQIVNSPALPFPANYALLFTLSGLTHIPSMIALGTIEEPDAAVVSDRSGRSMRAMLSELKRVWRGDPSFRRLMSVRWLTGLIDLATSFYVLHAAQMFGILQGQLLAARMVGSIVASVCLGWLSERRGPRVVVVLGSITALGSPALALIAHMVQPSAPVASLIYWAIYFLLGITFSSRMLGNMNYVMEMAPDEQRSLYIGLSNTLAGVLVPASFLGGVLLRWTNYPVLFGVTAACVACGMLVALGLKEPQPGPAASGGG